MSAAALEWQILDIAQKNGGQFKLHFAERTFAALVAQTTRERGKSAAAYQSDSAADPFAPTTSLGLALIAVEGKHLALGGLSEKQRKRWATAAHFCGWSMDKPPSDDEMLVSTGEAGEVPRALNALLLPLVSGHGSARRCVTAGSLCGCCDFARPGTDAPASYGSAASAQPAPPASAASAGASSGMDAMMALVVQGQKQTTQLMEFMGNVMGNAGAVGRPPSFGGAASTISSPQPAPGARASFQVQVVGGDWEPENQGDLCSVREGTMVTAFAQPEYEHYYQAEYNGSTGFIAKSWVQRGT